MVVPWIGNRVSLPAGSIGWVAGLTFRPVAWMNLMGTSKNEAAGFYGANLGPVPFAVGKLPQQDYFVVKVFSRVQFNFKPPNQERGKPWMCQVFPAFHSPGAIQSFFRGCRRPGNRSNQPASLKRRDKLKQPFNSTANANVDSNNPVVLNHLAWILAAANKPELRNGRKLCGLPPGPLP